MFQSVSSSNYLEPPTPPSRDTSPTMPPRTPIIPEGYLPFSEFDKLFDLADVTTEMDNPDTLKLSEVMCAAGGLSKGLEMLLSQEVPVVEAFRKFSSIFGPIALSLAEKAAKGGRIFFVGVGSSGRLALDLAAKVISVDPNFKCMGITGGGDFALILARETFEDSINEGEAAAKKLELTDLDTIFLLSSSGSTTFNVGFGHIAANKNCKVYYFYNSISIPDRTQALFKRPVNPVEPLLLDIGPPAISGSTRLQGYSVARMCFSYLLGQTLIQCGNSIDPNEISVDALCTKLLYAIKKIRKKIHDLKRIVQAESTVFISPQSNFRRVQDETKAGYITYLGTERTVREALIDAVEIPPTFSLSPYRREGKGCGKMPEYQAFLVGVDNEEAWNVVLGRKILFGEEWASTSEFLLSATAQGIESFDNRPQGPGNCVIGVEFLRMEGKISTHLTQALTKAKKKGAETILFVISEDKQEELFPNYESFCSQLVVIDGIKDDPLGLTSSQALKMALNLFSNATMTVLGKVFCGRMIDVRTSNNKLIDRCIRNICYVWRISNPSASSLSRENLYGLVIEAYEREKEANLMGKYTPSPLKVVFTMLQKKCNYPRAIIYLQDVQENIGLL